MESFYLWIAGFLLLNVVVGMTRIMAGPTRADRMLAAQLLGTTGVATLLLLAAATGEAAFRDVAFVFAILAAVATVAFVRRAGTAEPASERADNAHTGSPDEPDIGPPDQQERAG